jgi:futalosine hydrolase
MRILLVAATRGEMPAIAHGVAGAHLVDVLVTGVGMVATAAQVARALTQQRYDMAFNFGVCGSFDRSLPLGAVVHVTVDQLSELGAEDDERFLPLEQLGLDALATIENSAPPRNVTLDALPQVRGITVNTVHGCERTIAAVVSRCDPQVESMEGAAFAYACALAGVPYAQVRAVSNYVERRHREAWRLKLAIDNLHATAAAVLSHL